MRASHGRKAHCAFGAACSLSIEPLLALATSFCWIRPLRFSAAQARWGREHLRHGGAGGVRQGRPSPRRRRVSSLLRSEDDWLSSTACSCACRASTGFEIGAEIVGMSTQEQQLRTLLSAARRVFLAFSLAMRFARSSSRFLIFRSRWRWSAAASRAAAASLAASIETNGSCPWGEKKKDQ